MNLLPELETPQDRRMENLPMRIKIPDMALLWQNGGPACRSSS